MAEIVPMRRYDRQAIVDLDSPDPTTAINSFLHNMNKARALGFQPRTEHILAEHMFRGDAKLIFYSSFGSIMALVGDDELFCEDDDIDLQILELAAKSKRRRSQGKKAAEAVAEIARHFAQADTHRMAETVNTGSVRSMSGTVAESDAPNSFQNTPIHPKEVE